MIWNISSILHWGFSPFCLTGMTRPKALRRFVQCFTDRCALEWVCYTNRVISFPSEHYLWCNWTWKTTNGCKTRHTAYNANEWWLRELKFNKDKMSSVNPFRSTISIHIKVCVHAIFCVCDITGLDTLGKSRPHQHNLSQQEPAEHVVAGNSIQVI